MEELHCGFRVRDLAVNIEERHKLNSLGRFQHRGFHQRTLFAFFELGGGFVFNMAFNTFSNLAGASVSRSVLRVAIFFFGLRVRTNSLSAPPGRVLMFHQIIKLAGQPVPSNALPVGQSLSFDLFNRNFHSLAVCDVAIVPAELKFCGVAVEVFAAHMMEGTNNAALNQAKETFRRVHMRHASVFVLAGVFFDGVIHNVVAFELPPKSDVNASLICVDYGILGALIQARAQIPLRDTRHNFSADIALAFNERNDRSSAKMLRALIALSANECFVNFNCAFEQFCQRALAHCETNPVRHEPSRLVGDVEHPMQLVCAHSLFRGAKKEKRHEPFADGNMGILKDRSDRHRELLAAGTALVEPFAGRPVTVGAGRKCVNALGLAVVGAVRANRAVRPAKRFQKSAGLIGVGILLRERNQIQVFGTQCAFVRFHGSKIDP
jgi:hypothetical protein